MLSTHIFCLNTYENRSQLSNKFHVAIFMKLFFLFSRDFSFDIRHLFERDVYWCARSGIGVHYIQEVFNIVRLRACESSTALNEQYRHIIHVSTHVQMDPSKCGCHDVCINQSVNTNSNALLML